MIAFYLLYFYSFTLAQPPQTHTHTVGHTHTVRRTHTQSGTLLHTQTVGASFVSVFPDLTGD